MRLRAIGTAVVLVGLLSLGGAVAQHHDSPLPPFRGGLRDPVKSSIDRGLGYLRWSQRQDGSWDDDVPLTALALRTFFESHRAYVEADGPFIRNPLRFLEGRVGQGVSVTSSADGPASTSALSVLALLHASPPPDEILGWHLQFLRSIFSDAPAASRSQLDIHTLSFMMEALGNAGVPDTDDVWDRAVPLIEEAMSGAPRDPFERSTTVALGVHSLLLAGVDRDDPRIEDAARTLRSDYRIPDDGDATRAGVYHYVYALTRALHALGEPTLVDSDGAMRDWRTEIAGLLIALQDDRDSYWVGHSAFRSEDNPYLATSLALYSLELIYN